jgi:hypothetical protein
MSTAAKKVSRQKRRLKAYNKCRKTTIKNRNTVGEVKTPILLCKIEPPFAKGEFSRFERGELQNKR